MYEEGRKFGFENFHRNFGSNMPDLGVNYSAKENENRRLDSFKEKPLSKHKRSFRTNYSSYQVAILEEQFCKDNYLTCGKSQELAKQLNLPESKIKVWYQNRRAKYRHLRPVGWLSALFSDPAFAASVLQAAANTVSQVPAPPNYNPYSYYPHPALQMMSAFPPSLSKHPVIRPQPCYSSMIPKQLTDLPTSFLSTARPLPETSPNRPSSSSFESIRVSARTVWLPTSAGVETASMTFLTNEDNKNTPPRGQNATHFWAQQ